MGYFSPKMKQQNETLTGICKIQKVLVNSEGEATSALCSVQY